MSVINICKYNSPCGILMLGEFENKLCLCDWFISEHYKKNLLRLKNNLKTEIIEKETDVTNLAAKQLSEYFARKRRIFDIPILILGTEFQKKVLNELKNILYGQTISYLQLAYRIGSPKAVRAIANVNAQNQISIFLPCHRVIGTNGKLVGYGGGMEVKKYLLELENQDLLFRFN